MTYDQDGPTMTAHAEMGDRASWGEKPKGPRQKKPNNVPPLMTVAEFIAEAKPPEFLIEPFLQRGYLYTLTAKTSHGKTALFVYLAICVASPYRQFAGKHTSHGRVVILAGENPDDTAARIAAHCDHLGISPADLNVSVMKGAFDLKGNVELALAEIDKLDDVVLILIDTSSAYRCDPDEDDNQLSKEWAQAALRRLLEHPNNPTVIAATHPIKNADAHSLLPRGGGAFLNEVDGNLTTWASGDDGKGGWTQTKVHWQGKIRGISFAPIIFEFFTHPHPTATYHDGTPVMLTLLTPAQDQQSAKEQKQERLGPNEETALKILNSLFKTGAAHMAPVFENDTQGLVMDVETWREVFIREAMPGADPDHKRKAFSRVSASLLRRERIKCSDDYVWPV